MDEERTREHPGIFGGIEEPAEENSHVSEDPTGDESFGRSDVALRASDPLIASETLARLLEGQGLPEEAARVRAAAWGREDWRVVAISGAGLDWEGIRVQRAREGILCRWRVSPARVSAAERMVEEESIAGPELALRVVAAKDGATGHWDLRPIKEVGFCVLARDPKPDWVVVAVGLRVATGRFFPLVHSRVHRVAE